MALGLFEEVNTRCELLHDVFDGTWKVRSEGDLRNLFDIDAFSLLAYYLNRKGLAPDAKVVGSNNGPRTKIEYTDAKGKRRTFIELHHRIYEDKS